VSQTDGRFGPALYANGWQPVRDLRVVKASTLPSPATPG
jgi:hypothetical protein